MMRFIKTVLMIIGGIVVLIIIIAIFNGGSFNVGKTPQSTTDTKTSLPPQTSQKTFNEPGYGYSINYPTDWVYEKPNNHTVLFSGQKGTEAYDATVNVQNLASTQNSGKYASVNDVINDFKSQLNTAKNVKITDDETFDFVTAQGHTVQGKMFSAGYTLSGTDYKQLQMIVPNSAGTLFYSLTYTAPANIYDKYTPIRALIITSFTILD